MEARVHERLSAYHLGKSRFSDRAIDRLLGIRVRTSESKLHLLDLLRRSGPGSYDYQGASYETARDLFRWCRPSPSDVFYDLGSGYGRIVLYGAVLSAARFRGVEIVKERAIAAENCRASLGLTHVRLDAGDAATASFGDGTIFFLFNPFFSPTLARVGARIRELATRRRVRIASLALSNDYFSAQTWLDEVTPSTWPKRRYGLRFFVSRAVEAPRILHTS